MFRKTLVLLAVVGILATFGLAGSALFTSTTTVGNNSFTTGSVLISTDPVSALVTFSNMAPGDQVTAPLTVKNDGTLAMRYAMTSLATNEDNKALRGQLELSVKSGVTDCSNAGFAASGTSVYGGTLNNALFGDPATGQQAGDRALAAGANEVLCFNVALPAGTGNEFQNAATTATFTFAAEQTANN
jgi:spore coat-associated protein N